MEKQEKVGKSENKTDLNCNPRTVPDGGWGWLVSVAGFFVQFIVLGLQNNVGLLSAALLADFKKSKFQTAWVSSLALGNMFLFAPLTTALCEKYGCRRVGILGGLLTVVGMLTSSFANNLYVLYLTFGIVYGAGTSMCFVSTLRTLPYWFSRNLATATGIVSAGSGVGTLAVGPVLEILILAYGWKNAARIFSGLLVIPTLMALVYRVPVSPSSQCNNETVIGHGKPKMLDLSVFKNRTFVALCAAVSTFTMGYFVPFVYVPIYAQALNVPKKSSSILIGLMSVGSTFGRLSFGKLSDCRRVNRLYLYQISFLFMGIADFLVPLITNFTGFVIYMISFGIFDGCFVTLMAVSVNDVVSCEKFSSGLGIKFFFIAITTFVGPPIAGKLIEVSGSYNVAFLAAGGTAVAAAGLMFVVHWLLPKKICTRKGTTSEVGIEEIPDQHELEEGQGFSTRSVGEINYAMDGDRKGKTSEVGIEEIPDQHEPEAPTTPNVGKINYAMDGDRKGKISEVGIEKIPDQHEPEAPTTPNIGKINYAMDGDLTSTDDSSIVKAPPFLNGHAGGPAEKASCPKDETVLPKTMAVDVQLNHISIDEKNLSGASS